MGSSGLPYRVLSLAAVLLVALAPKLVASGSEVPRRPNVVLILSDDQRPDTIRALGNEQIETPNLDALVREGAVFRRATCAYPLCVPSRAELLTGRVAFGNGVHLVPTPGGTQRNSAGNRLDPSLPLWPETMRRAGYQTWHVGKWHVSGRPSQRGYERSDGLFASGRSPANPQRDRHGRVVTGYVGWQFQTDDGQLFPDKGIGLGPNISEQFADAAIRLIHEGARSEKPFFLHVNFTAPHDPRFFPMGYEAKYDAARLTLPANFLPEHPFDHGNSRGRDELLLPFPRTAAEVRDELAVYYAVITHMDREIGRVMDSLKAAGEWDNTIVIFASDHGLALGSHGLVGKQNMYEHTIGVPLIVRGPGIPAGVRLDAQCYLRDLFPTVCEWAGIEIPASVQGRSLAGVLRGQVDQVYPFIVGYFQDSQRMIRDDRWKLIHYPKLDRVQLFDLESDGNEMQDRSSDPRHKDVVELLRRQLTAWLRAHGDPLAPSDLHR